MKKILIQEKCVFRGGVYNVGDTITMSDADFEKEVALGKHPIQGVWISSVLNHGRKLDPVVALDADLIADDEAKSMKGAA